MHLGEDNLKSFKNIVSCYYLYHSDMAYIYIYAYTELRILINLFTKVLDIFSVDLSHTLANQHMKQHNEKYNLKSRRRLETA